jgi:hypothetical protein
MDLLKELLKIKAEDLKEDINKAEVDKLVAEALDAFWKVITDKHPSVDPKRLPHDALMKFEKFDKEATEIINILLTGL